MASIQAYTQHIHHFDLRDFNLGFSMGVELNGYNVTTQRDQFDDNTGRTVRKVEMVRRPGINLGLITNLKLGNNFDLRFIPSVSLQQVDFNYNFYPVPGDDRPLVETKKIEASYLNLPLMLKFKSNFHTNHRVYFMAGPSVKWNLVSDKRVTDNLDLLKIRDVNLCMEFAAGVDLYGEKLKLNPEIHFSMGLRDIYVPINTRYPKAISDLFSQTLTFRLNFE